jgi:probable rRNA maturation factor
MRVELLKERGTRPLRCRRRLLNVLREAQELAGLGGDGRVLHVIFAREETIVSLNEGYVHHHGITDVITFDYRDGGEPCDADGESCAGEIYVCAEIAVSWAARYGQHTPSKELVLYMIHGMLHLGGEDDLTPAARRRMRAAERRVLSALERRHSLQGFL